MIALRRIGKRFGERRILEDVSLEIASGERLALVGPSGSGKTTLLRLIAGLDAPDTGTVEIGGVPVSRDGKILVGPEKRGVGMVFQDLALWPHMRVEENIGFGMQMRKVPKAERRRRVAELLEMTGLAGFGRRYPSELSGGERQRVALARALALRPDILLTDEPFSGLDETLRHRLTGEVVALQERLGFTLVHVTHDRTEAAAISTRTVRLKPEEGSGGL